MTTESIARDLVALCSEGRDREVVDRYYAEDIVSIEGASSPESPARIQGRDAVLEKHAWWYNNHEIHGTRAEGPYMGAAPDQFAVRFEIDLTPKGGTRQRMSEIALYTVEDGRIVQEAFLFHLD